MKRVLLLAVVLGSLSGCCAPQPARMDPKKAQAHRDEVAVIVSWAIMFSPPSMFKEVEIRGQAVNADTIEMTSR